MEFCGESEKIYEIESREGICFVLFCFGNVWSGRN